MPTPTDDPDLIARLRSLGWAGPGSPTPRVTRIAAYGVIRRGPRILLCRVAPDRIGAGRWTLPGGGIEFGESPDVAAAREVEEETGLVARITAEPRILSDTGTWPVGADTVTYHQVRFVYPMAIVSGSERPEVRGSSDEIGWFAPAELASLPLEDLVERVLLEP